MKRGELLERTGVKELKEICIEDLITIQNNYNEVLKFLKRYLEMREQFNKQMRFDNVSLNPFINEYALERLVVDIKNELVRFVVHQLNNKLCPNININTDEVKEALIKKFEKEKSEKDLGLDTNFILKYIHKNFMEESDELSKSEILRLARNLVVPYVWVNHWVNHEKQLPTVETLVSGKKMTLDKYSERSVSALDKLVVIVLDSVNPTTAAGGSLTQLIQTNGRVFDVAKIGDRHIEKVRFYKKGKVEVWFDTEENARKVAEALIEW